MVPEGHARFAGELCDRYGVPPLREGAQLRDTAALAWSEQVARQQLEVALEFSPVLLVNALGVPPADVVARVQARGIKVGALAGRVRHAIKQKEAGVYLWDDCGHEPHTIVFGKNFRRLPMPAQDLDDIQLANGVSIRCTEPLRRYELAYRDPSASAVKSSPSTATACVTAPGACARSSAPTYTARGPCAGATATRRPTRVTRST